jgi:hypothetical protein
MRGEVASHQLEPQRPPHDLRRGLQCRERHIGSGESRRSRKPRDAATFRPHFLGAPGGSFTQSCSRVPSPCSGRKALNIASSNGEQRSPPSCSCRGALTLKIP